MSQLQFNLMPDRKVWTVSELTARIRDLLARNFTDIWVTGEISNAREAQSGHFYFTLKDASAQIRCVCFKQQLRLLKFRPEGGLQVTVRGSLSVYEARGEYQIYVETIDPVGLGALQLAFEQLKKRLEAEGLFDSRRKKPLPLLPRRIGLITSPRGAAVRDVVRILLRRFPNVHLTLYPVRVQGEGAAAEIVEALRFFNRKKLVDVLILARGGGSLEDLWAFNEEIVARAIADSAIPLISGVGHETDFTIADFVADLRAPTPSAAAELVVQRKQDFVAELESHAHRMSQIIRLKLSEARQQLIKLALHRVFQTLTAKVSERAQRVDDCVTALDRSLRRRLSEARHEYLQAAAGVHSRAVRQLLSLKRAQLAARARKFETEFKRYSVE